MARQVVQNLVVLLWFFQIPFPLSGVHLLPFFLILALETDAFSETEPIGRRSNCWQSPIDLLVWHDNSIVPLSVHALVVQNLDLHKSPMTVHICHSTDGIQSKLSCIDNISMVRWFRCSSLLVICEGTRCPWNGDIAISSE